MESTDVVLRDEMGLRVPSVPEVAVISANSVTFSVEEGANSALYFSPETASILSPKPGARVELAFDQKLVYTFGGAVHGTFGVITQAPGDPAPESFDFGKPSDPPILVIQPGSGVDFPVASNSTQT
jgi:hypothetical protein